MAVTALKTSLTGLPRRLVKDGIVEASAMEQAIDDAREDKTPLVAWLVAKNLADSRDLAQAAAQVCLDHRFPGIGIPGIGDLRRNGPDFLGQKSVQPVRSALRIRR